MMRVALRSLGVLGLLTLAGLAAGWSEEKDAVGVAEKRAPADLPSLDEALRAEAAKIVDEVVGQKYRNVGVLKFMVRGDGGDFRDGIGNLNYTLPDRLEVALVLALKNED